MTRDERPNDEPNTPNPPTLPGYATNNKRIIYPYGEL